MKRYVISLLIPLLLFVGLTGCQRSQPGSPSLPAPQLPPSVEALQLEKLKKLEAEKRQLAYEREQLQSKSRQQAKQLADLQWHLRRARRQAESIRSRLTTSQILLELYRDQRRRTYTSYSYVYRTPSYTYWTYPSYTICR